MALPVETKVQENVERLSQHRSTRTKPSGRFAIEGARWTHRPVRKALGRSCSVQLLALTLTAIATAYLLLRCLKHLSLSHGAVPRGLASGGFDRDGRCHYPPRSVDEDKQYKEQTGTGPAAHSTTGTTADDNRQADEVASPVSPDGEFLVDLPRRQQWNEGEVPFRWQMRIEAVLRQALLPPTLLRQLLPVIRPYNAVCLARHLARLAALEVGAFSSSDSTLYPMLTKVAESYVEILNEVLRTENTRAASRPMRTEFVKIQALLTELAKKPDPRIVATENLHRHKETVFTQLQLSSATQDHVVFLLRGIASWKDDNRGIPDELVRPVLNTLNSLFHARRRQILGNNSLCRRIHLCQNQVAPWLLYEPWMWYERKNIALRKLEIEKQEIHRAVESLPPRGSIQLSPPPQPLGDQYAPGMHPLLGFPLIHTKPDPIVRFPPGHQIALLPPGFLQQNPRPVFPSVPPLVTPLPSGAQFPQQHHPHPSYPVLPENFHLQRPAFQPPFFVQAPYAPQATSNAELSSTSKPSGSDGRYPREDTSEDEREDSDTYLPQGFDNDLDVWSQIQQALQAYPNAELSSMSKPSESDGRYPREDTSEDEGEDSDTYLPQGFDDDLDVSGLIQQALQAYANAELLPTPTPSESDGRYPRQEISEEEREDSDTDLSQGYDDDLDVSSLIQQGVQWDLALAEEKRKK